MASTQQPIRAATPTILQGDHLDWVSYAWQPGGHAWQLGGAQRARGAGLAKVATFARRLIAMERARARGRGDGR